MIRFHTISSLVVSLFLMAVTSVSAQKRDRYEFYKDFPMYADSLLAQLTYPMAWGNSDIKDFDKWKQAARGKMEAGCTRQDAGVHDDSAPGT